VLNSGIMVKKQSVGDCLCDGCGEVFTGEAYKVYDENFNECHGLTECSKCFASRLHESFWEPQRNRKKGAINFNT